MILLTGGTGMLGSYLLLDLLKQGQQIIAAKRPQSTLVTTKQVFDAYEEDGKQLFKSIKWVNVDLFSQEDIEQNLDGVSQIYHCAAYISASGNNKDNLIKNNQIITENIVNASLQKKIEKFCYVSSISALGNTQDKQLINEKTLWKPNKNYSSYSISKYYSEMEVWRGIAEGLNAVIVNPSVILGVGDWNKGSANLFKKIFDGLKFYTHGSSGFVNAKDVSLIMIKLMQDNSTFKQNYIVSAENLDFKILFDKMAKALSVKAPFIYAKPFLTQLAWRIEWLKSV